MSESPSDSYREIINHVGNDDPTTLANDGRNPGGRKSTPTDLVNLLQEIGK